MAGLGGEPDSLPSGGLLTNSTVASAIRSGQAGSLAQTYQGAGFLPNPNFSFFGCGCFIGDYAGVAASDTVLYPVWTDGRDSAYQQTGLGETDIFTDIEFL